MDNSIFIALLCSISPGAFSGERIFSVKLSNSDIYTGISPREFCWNGSDLLVEKDEPNPGSDSRISGKIAARILRAIDDDEFIVEVPDGRSIVVDKQIIVPRPTRITVDSVAENSYVLV